MASTATTSLKIEKLEPGVATSWGDEINTDWDIVDSAIAGRVTVSLNGADNTLNNANYTDDDAKKAVLYTNDADADDRSIIIPNATRVYRVINASSSYNCKVKTSAGTAITIPASSTATVICDGSNVVTFGSAITNTTTGAPNTASGAAASAVSVTPSGDLTSTDVQAALVELQGDVDAIESDLTSNYQPLDPDLTAIAALAATKGNLQVGGASGWTALGVGTDGFVPVAASGEAAGMKWAALIEAGTKQLFYQASAPTGWTAVALNDYGLRIVSAGGTGGSTGGSAAFSTVFAITATDGHALTISEMPSHLHGNGTLSTDTHVSTEGGGTQGVGGGTGPLNVASVANESHSHDVTGSTSEQGGDSSHSHNIDLQLQYADVIVATKDAF